MPLVEPKRILHFLGRVLVWDSDSGGMYQDAGSGPARIGIVRFLDGSWHGFYAVKNTLIEEDANSLSGLKRRLRRAVKTVNRSTNGI